MGGISACSTAVAAAEALHSSGHACAAPSSVTICCMTILLSVSVPVLSEQSIAIPASSCEGRWGRWGRDGSEMGGAMAMRGEVGGERGGTMS